MLWRTEFGCRLWLFGLSAMADVSMLSLKKQKAANYQVTTFIFPHGIQLFGIADIIGN